MIPVTHPLLVLAAYRLWFHLLQLYRQLRTLLLIPLGMAAVVVLVLLSGPPFDRPPPDTRERLLAAAERRGDRGTGIEALVAAVEAGTVAFDDAADLLREPRPGRTEELGRDGLVEVDAGRRSPGLFGLVTLLGFCLAGLAPVALLTRIEQDRTAARLLVTSAPPWVLLVGPLLPSVPSYLGLALIASGFAVGALAASPSLALGLAAWASGPVLVFVLSLGRGVPTAWGVFFGGGLILAVALAVGPSSPLVPVLGLLPPATWLLVPLRLLAGTIGPPEAALDVAVTSAAIAALLPSGVRGHRRAMLDAAAPPL